MHVELHRYLSAAAVHSSPGVIIDEMLRLPPGFRHRALATHLLTSSVAAAAMDAVEAAIRALTPQSARRFAETRGFVAGPVAWTQTLQRRVTTGDPTLFITQLTHRTHDTAAARLVKYAALRLKALTEVGLDMDAATGIGVQGSDIAARSRAALTTDKLASVRAPHSLDADVVAAVVRRRPELAPVADLSHAADAVLAGGDIRSLVAGLLDGVLVPAGDDDLFELWVGLRMLRALSAAGMTVTPFPLEPGDNELRFALIKGSASTWVMTWRRSAWSLPGVTGTGVYAKAAAAAGIPTQALRPDFVMLELVAGQGRLRIVEVKHTSTGAPVERDGLRECLAYVEDLRTAGGVHHPVRCLVVASNSVAKPGAGQYAITGPADLDAAARSLLV